MIHVHSPPLPSPPAMTGIVVAARVKRHAGGSAKSTIPNGRSAWWSRPSACSTEMHDVMTDSPKPDSPVVVIGAGPHGLSAVAHLRAAGVPTRAFGRSLEF